MTHIYATTNKSVILSALEQTNGFVFGYDLRTEVFMRIPRKELTKETHVSVFGCVGINNKAPVGRIACFYNARGICFDELSKCTGLSIRTLHRHINMNSE
ncbi:MAG: hypothetical protein ACYC5G_03990 [Candidatus Doudnabacteria bacterium]